MHNDATFLLALPRKRLIVITAYVHIVSAMLPTALANLQFVPYVRQCKLFDFSFDLQVATAHKTIPAGLCSSISSFWWCRCL